MFKKNKNSLCPVSIVIAHRNSSSTILYTLRGIKKQTYPIREVIIVDNHSTDDSFDKIRKFSSKNKSLSIKIIFQSKNRGVSSSFNLGVKASKSDGVIIMHADGALPSSKEVGLLMSPVIQGDDNIAVIGSITLMPRYVWNKYNFWEKCLLARSVDKEAEGFNGKFNYVNKKLYLKVGGFDEKIFWGEDADFIMRIKKIGKVVETNARVIHLHYIGDNYSIADWILNRKLLARDYGKVIRMHKFNLPLGILLVLIKPALAFASFIPFLFPYNFLTMIIFSFLYMQIMYTTRETLLNPRIFLLPFISIALIYYETFWMLEQLLSPVKKWEGVR